MSGGREALLAAASGMDAEGNPLPILFASLLPMPAGEPDPNRWTLDHWGTKGDVWQWIGLEQTQRSFVASFGTALAAPTTLLETVSRQFPTLAFRLHYWDEDGDYSGTATVKNGEMRLVEHDLG
ncbi:MAG: hypothetical protein H7Z41_09395 [Cytophagales bacterium]|nr:hypothetical protein [Armatimonadota bacterium]